ncbi:MAG: hypothetical protein HKN33_17635 [Pyrinomonadaceae bacterium]|nr:hypothetical protein [Pyrinomonadaceae bacterium]
MKNIIAKVMLIIVVVAGVSSSAVANPKLRKANVKFEIPGRSLLDIEVFQRRHLDVKHLYDFVISQLMSPMDIDGPVGGNPRSGDSKTKG